MLFDVLLPCSVGVVDNCVLLYGLGVVLVKYSSVLFPLADLLAALKFRGSLRSLQRVASKSCRRNVACYLLEWALASVSGTAEGVFDSLWKVVGFFFFF